MVFFLASDRGSTLTILNIKVNLGDLIGGNYWQRTTIQYLAGILIYDYDNDDCTNLPSHNDYIAVIVIDVGLNLK